MVSLTTVLVQLKCFFLAVTFVNCFAKSLDSDQDLRGGQWLSGRVLDSRLRGCGFKPH